MSRDLEHLLNATAAEPSRPVDPAEITRLARKRRRRRRAGTAIAAVAATAGLVAAVSLPLSGSANDVTRPPAADSDPLDVPPQPTDPAEIVEPYGPGFDCPVTEPPTPGLVPPDGYPAEPSDQAHAGAPRPDNVWFGTEDLWTVLPVDGGYGQRKSVWWSTEFPGGAQEPQPNIEVTWERLDVDAGAYNHGRGTNAHTAEDGQFMIAGIDPVEPGCWRVTAEYKGAELSYVYEIPVRAGEDESEPVEAAPSPEGTDGSEDDTEEASAPLAGSGDVRQADIALAEGFLALAADPSPETAARLPFAATVRLGLGPDLLVERTTSELSNPEAWLIEEEAFRGHTGPFSTLESVRRHVAGEKPAGLQVSTDTQVEVGDYQYCAGSPLSPPPEAVGSLRRVSIQAADDSVTSLLGMFYVDLYVDDDGLVHAATLDLCAP